MIIVLRFFMMSVILCAIAGAVVAQPTSRGTMHTQSVEQSVKKLHELLHEHWEYTLRTSPELASIIGDKRYNDKLSDFSQAAINAGAQCSTQKNIPTTRFLSYNCIEVGGGL